MLCSLTITHHFKLDTECWTFHFFLWQVDNHVTDAISKGAKAIVGGKKHAKGGNFYEPTVLTNIKPDMLVAKEEIFGPVAPIIKLVNRIQVFLSPFVS